MPLYNQLIIKSYRPASNAPCPLSIQPSPGYSYGNLFTETGGKTLFDAVVPPGSLIATSLNTNSTAIDVTTIYYDREVSTKCIYQSWRFQPGTFKNMR